MMTKRERAKRKSARARKRHTQRPKDVFIGRLKGKIRIVGDIVSPVEPADAWQYDINNIDSKRGPQS